MTATQTTGADDTPVPPDPDGTPPATPSRLPVEERGYYSFYRTPANRWWKGALALLLLLVVGVATQVVLVVIMVVMLWPEMNAGVPFTDLTLSPALFLANNLALAVLLPASMLIQWLCFGQRPRWLSSVEGGFRWSWAGRITLVLLPLFVVYAAVSVILVPMPATAQTVGTMAFMLAVVLLTTPLQAAGEEYGFRGLVGRVIGSWIPNRTVALIVGALVSSALFSAAHFAADPWLVGYYFVFGVIGFMLTAVTGGLEAGVVVHVVNNVVLLLFTVPSGAWQSSFDRGVGTGGPFMLLPAAVLTGFAALVIVMAKRRHLTSTGAPGIPCGSRVEILG